MAGEPVLGEVWKPQAAGREENPAFVSANDEEAQGPILSCQCPVLPAPVSSDLCCASHWPAQGLAHGRGSRNICGMNGCVQDSQVYLGTSLRKSKI